MQEIEFFNREREIKVITDILKSTPNLITFIYGPINSGKTELINHILKQLPREYRAFYINLRGVYVSKAEDFLKVLFDVRGKSIKDCIKFALELLPSEVITPKGRFPIPKQTLKRIFEKNELENIFVYLENFLNEVAKKKNPIFILDELQVIGDVKIDDLLVYKLFNFFVRLTKELHLCHVFVITSDSLFIERVYNEAMLQGRCEYLLVDDFDYETTVKFLKKYKFNEKEIKLIWEYFGGKPIYLLRAVRAKKNGENLNDVVNKFFKLRVSQIKDVIYELEEEDKELFNRVIELFKRFRDMEKFEYERLSKEILFCVRKNILFVDPVERTVRPQSRLDLMAMREVIKLWKGG